MSQVTAAAVLYGLADNRRGQTGAGVMKMQACRRGVWLPVGVGIGAAMGAATGDMGTWVALGAGIGAALDAVRRRGRC
jgi:hypothetical protein